MKQIKNMLNRLSKSTSQQQSIKLSSNNGLIYTVFAIITVVTCYPLLAQAQSVTSEVLSSIDTLFKVIGLLVIIYAVVILLKKGKTSWKRVASLFIIGIVLYIIGRIASAYAY